MMERQDYEQRSRVISATYDFVEWINREAEHPEGYRWEVDPGGRRYIRIVMSTHDDPTTGQRRGRSVHAFVDNVTGDLLKAASWSAPAKGARYNLLSEMDVVKTNFYWTGSYLYADWKRVS